MPSLIYVGPSAWAAKLIAGRRWGSERLIHLFRVTQLAGSRVWDLNPCSPHACSCLFPESLLRLPSFSHGPLSLCLAPSPLWLCPSHIFHPWLQQPGSVSQSSLPPSRSCRNPCRPPKQSGAQHPHCPLRVISFPRLCSHVRIISSRHLGGRGRLAAEQTARPRELGVLCCGDRACAVLVPPCR